MIRGARAKFFSEDANVAWFILPCPLGVSRLAPPRIPMDVAEECRPAVQALVARILRRGRADPDVEDCTHETFRRAWEHPERRHPGEPLLPWLLGIARHVALDTLRAEYRRRARLVPGDLERDPSEIPNPEAARRSTPESDWSRRQRVERLQEALDSLPREQREAFLLFHGEELSYREISERLGVPVGTVGTWVLRARRSLGNILAREADFEGDA